MAGRTHPLVIAHRGASGYRPEHTEAAYRLAIALGADAIEPDIVASKDGVLVLRHENEISGTTDVADRAEFVDRRTTKEIDGAPLSGWFTEDFTWAELATLRARERIPKLRPTNADLDGRFGLQRLSDLLALLDESTRAVGMVAELKHASYFAGIDLPLDELFHAELAAAGWAMDDARLRVEAFELTVLEQLRQGGIRAPRVFLLEASGTPFDQQLALGPAAPAYADLLTESGLPGLASRVDGISVDKAVLLAPDAAGMPAGFQLVERAHAQGLDVFTWTLRPENRFLSPAFRSGDDTAAFGDWEGEFERILSMGVDAVFADHPDLALHSRRHVPGRP